MVRNKFLEPIQPVILVAWLLSFALATTSWAAKPDTSVPAKPEENDAEGHPTDYKNPIRDGNAGGVPHYHVTICEGTTLGWNPWGSGHRNSEPQSDQSKNRDTTPSAKSGKSHAAASSAGGTDGQVAIEGRTEGSTECTITLKEDDGTVRTLVVLVHVVKCTNANKGHRGITESPISLPTGNTLGNLIHDGKVRFDSVGTGETIGHIADFHIENLTDEPINCVVPPMILESSSGKNQHYACPKGQTVEVPPHDKKTVPMDGVCIARNKPPVGKGVPGDLVVNDGNPNTPQDPNSHISPKDAEKLLHLCSSKYDAADKLYHDGKLKGIPYSDPQKQKDIVVQWSTWSDPQISEITGAPPATKDDLKKVVYKQLEPKGPMSPETKKKVDQGINTIFEKVELTTAKAKELEPEPQDYTQTERPAGSFEVSDENEVTPIPWSGPLPQTKEKEKKKEPGPKKYPPEIQKWFDAWQAARRAEDKKDQAQYGYKKALQDWCLGKSKHYKELKDARDKAKEKAAAKDATQQDKDNLSNAQKELDKQEKELEKEFQKTDTGKDEFKKFTDAEKEANKADAAEKEAGKNIDPDVKKAIIDKED
jgi:hypothetical protein